MAFRPRNPITIDGVVYPSVRIHNLGRIMIEPSMGDSWQVTTVARFFLNDADVAAGKECAAPVIHQMMVHEDNQSKNIVNVVRRALMVRFDGAEI